VQVFAQLTGLEFLTELPSHICPLTHLIIYNLCVQIFGQDQREIEQVMFDNPGYGYRRVSIALNINHKRAKRVMEKYNLKPARRAKSPRKKADEGNENP
jgi:hypothetical protein